MDMGLGALTALFEGNWYDSPFIVPVAGCAMIGSIVVAGIWSGVRTREIRSQERLARIAQGLPVEPEMDDAVAAAMSQANAGRAATVGGIRRPNDGGGARRAGVVLVSVGMGLLLFFFALTVIVNEREVMAGGAAGLIPLAIGVGFLVDARAKRREYERFLEWERNASTADGSYAGSAAATGSAVGSVPPPPPPPGMSEAQVSDWRPLH